MTEQEVVELVNAQAEALAHDEDLPDEKQETFPEAAQPLMALAREVKEALPPVEPRSDFIAELKGELRAQARQLREQLALEEKRQHRAIWFVAAFGGLVYFLGLVAVGLKISWSLVSFLAGLLGWKMTRPASSKTRVVHS